MILWSSRGILARITVNDVSPTKVIEERVVNQHTCYNLQWSKEQIHKHDVDGEIFVDIRYIQKHHSLVEPVYNIEVDEDNSYVCRNTSVHNCRLQLDFDFKQNSFGGGGVKVGSMRVANLNLPRIAYIARENVSKMTNLEKDSIAWRSKVEVEYDVLIRYYTDIAIQYLAAYHEIFKDLVDRGFLKFFREPHQWFSINMFFATVGFCGIYDAAEMIDTDRIVDIMEKTVNTLVYKTKGKSNGMKFNIEEVPSESAAGTMVKFNRDFGEKKQYYSNQFLPLSFDIPLTNRIAIEAKLQSKLTGGGMTFLNFDAKLTQKQSLEIHKYMMDLGFTGQFCINYGFSYCPLCRAMMIGKHSKVCTCGTQADFYTRVVGYLAKVKNTCASKALEIGERHNYRLTTLS